MKEKIHPEYKETTVSCACGEVFKTRSTKGDIKLDICSKCHPFYTGKQKLIDAAGRVDRFKKRYRAAKAKKEDAPQAAPGQKAEKPEAPAQKADAPQAAPPQQAAAPGQPGQPGQQG